MSAKVVVAARYQLVERIAIGGMGEVWEAHDDLLGRQVALKLPRPELAADETFRRRFRAEARAAASLNHPGVATVFDYGEDGDGGGSAYLVMELVDGQPLSALLQRGPLSVERTLDVVVQTAAALEAAHRRGIVHRDVKPANLLVSRQGTVKVTDFGIARAADSSSLTQTGTVLGTTQYMSPEQAQGRPTTPASDIYSLGVVAYQCLAGRPPFSGEGSMAVALAHIHDPVPPLPRQVPSRVADLVAAMLQKDPALRPRSAGEVARLAEALRHGFTAPATDVSTPLDDTRAGTAIPARTVRSPGTVVLDHAPYQRRTPPGERPLRRAERRRRRRRITVLGVAGALVAAVIVPVALLGGSPPGRLPDLRGLTLTAARHRLSLQGWKVADRSTDTPGKVAGTVLTQHPAPGARTSQGSTVTLTVASGYVRLNEASFSGQQYSSAAAVLTSLGLVPAERTVTSSAASPGTILSITPSGQVRSASTVSVTVAVAPPTTTTTTAPTHGPPAAPTPSTTTNGPGAAGPVPSGPHGHGHP